MAGAATQLRLAAHFQQTIRSFRSEIDEAGNHDDRSPAAGLLILQEWLDHHAYIWCTAEASRCAATSRRLDVAWAVHHCGLVDRFIEGALQRGLVPQQGVTGRRRTVDVVVLSAIPLRQCSFRRLDLLAHARRITRR